MVNLKDAPPPPPEFDGENSLSPHLGPSRSDLRRGASRLRSLSDAGSIMEHSRRLRFSSSTDGEGGSLSHVAPGSLSNIHVARGSRRMRFSSLTEDLESGSMSNLTGGSKRMRLSDSEEETNEPVQHEDTEEGEDDPALAEDGTLERVYSDGSLMMDDDDEDFETLRDSVTKRRAPSTLDNGPRQRYVFGRPLPLWCTTRPRATQMAACLAKYAPCFWCSRESLSLTTTNQAILLRLNSLTAFFALAQVASASFLVAVLWGDLLDRRALYVDRGRNASLVNTPNLWSVNGSILGAGCLGVCTLVGMLWSRRSIREISLPGSLRFMWFMYWIIPIQVYLFVSMFDYHNVTNVWIRHWWAAASTAWFRSNTCAGGTYQTRCVVPIDGLPLFQNETAWCEFYYATTDCEQIRNDAQAQTAKFSYFYYYINGAVGIAVFFLLILIAKVLEGVITQPIMQKSRERNIFMWLTLPIVGCLATGSVLLFSPSSILRYDTAETKAWPGLLYLVAGGLYFIAACLGYCISRFAILNTRDKHSKLFFVTLFIATMTLTLLAVAAVFVGSLLLSTSYVDNTMDDTLRGNLACSISAGSCSFCDNNRGLRECPEWSEADVASVIKTQLKASATLAALFMIYSIGAVRFGYTLRQHISLYQIDYV